MVNGLNAVPAVGLTQCLVKTVMTRRDDGGRGGGGWGRGDNPETYGNPARWPVEDEKRNKLSTNR